MEGRSVNGKLEKLYFLDYKKDGTRPPSIDLAMALHGFGIDNIAAQNAIEGSKALHARRWQTVPTVLRGTLSLMFVIHLSTVITLLPLAQMPIHDGGTGMRTMLD